MVAEYYKPVGPWGIENGTSWTDGIYSDIKTIVIRHGAVIDAIQVDYIIRGKGQDYPVSAPQHGGDKGSATTIELGEGEYIAKVKGSYGLVGASGYAVSSLQLATSTGRVFGPYGTQTATTFETETPAKIVGFFGRSANYVLQLGFFLVHF